MTLITRDQVAAKLLEYKEKYPNNVNPTAPSQFRRSDPDVKVCVYTSKDGKFHCIGGQVILDLTGIVIPYDVRESINEMLMEEWNVPLDYEARDLLSRAQSKADRNTPTWGEVIDDLIHEKVLVP
jgi:hypothetical protein